MALPEVDDHFDRDEQHGYKPETRPQMTPTLFEFDRGSISRQHSVHSRGVNRRLFFEPLFKHKDQQDHHDGACDHPEYQSTVQPAARMVHHTGRVHLEVPSLHYVRSAPSRREQMPCRWLLATQPKALLMTEHLVRRNRPDGEGQPAECGRPQGISCRQVGPKGLPPLIHRANLFIQRSGPAPLDDPDQQNDDSKNQQDMNKTSHRGAADQPQGPKNDEYNRDCPQHLILRFDFLRTQAGVSLTAPPKVGAFSFC